MPSILSVTFSILSFYIIDAYVQSNDTFLYFAYGSNLLTKRIHINNPSAEFYGIAKLQDYRLDFNMYVKEWNGAVSTIIQTDGKHVWGVLWVIKRDQMKSLDRQEGVHRGWYYAKNVTVFTNEGEMIQARAYEETKNPNVYVDPGDLPYERRPSNTYLLVIILGALEHKLPSDYIGLLTKVPSNGKYADITILKQLQYPFI